MLGCFVGQVIFESVNLRLSDFRFLQSNQPTTAVKQENLRKWTKIVLRLIQQDVSRSSCCPSEGFKIHFAIHPEASLIMVILSFQFIR